MVRLRLINGKRLKVSEEVPFIEICDADGNLGALILQERDGKDIKVVFPGLPSFDNYRKLFKSKTADIIVHEPKRN